MPFWSFVVSEEGRCEPFCYHSLGYFKIIILAQILVSLDKYIHVDWHSHVNESAWVFWIFQYNAWPILIYFSVSLIDEVPEEWGSFFSEPRRCSVYSPVYDMWQVQPFANYRANIIYCYILPLEIPCSAAKRLVSLCCWYTWHVGLLLLFNVGLVILWM